MNLPIIYLRIQHAQGQSYHPFSIYVFEKLSKVSSSEASQKLKVDIESMIFQLGKKWKNPLQSCPVSAYTTDFVLTFAPFCILCVFLPEGC